MQGERYTPPSTFESVSLMSLIEGVRSIDPIQQRRLALPGAVTDQPRDVTLFCAGNRDLVKRKAVAIVGARKVSPEGAARARKLARELVHAGVVVVSGLAEGVDTEAHTSAIGNDGDTIAVIGTPLDAVYPAANKKLQEAIYRHHLLVSQFPSGTGVRPWHFPQRNKIMAAISDATVIIEASDTSGSLHQAAECMRLNRLLFIAKSVIDNPKLTWPAKFAAQPMTRVLAQTSDILEAIGACPSR